MAWKKPTLLQVGFFGTPFCGPPIGVPNCCKTQLFLRIVKDFGVSMVAHCQKWHEKS